MFSKTDDDEDDSEQWRHGFLRWARWIMATLLFTGIVVVLATMLTSCTNPLPVPPPLEQSLLRRTLSALGAGGSETPGINVIYGSTSCQWNGPNPVITANGLPRVGRELVVRWQLSVIPPPPKVLDADGIESPPLVFLLGSTRPLEAPMPGGAAAPGCQLLVYPDFSFAPAPESWLTFDAATHVVTLRFTPANGMEGADLYSQLLVVMPGANPIGLISSAGLRLHIGT